MENFGEELKRAREALGIPLRDMATRTKISIGTLEALEKSDFRRIPGGIFGRSFVRTYALEAGLEPDAMVTRFGEELAEAELADAERRRARQPAITLDDQQFLDRQKRAYLLLRVAIVAAVIAMILFLTWAVRGLWATDTGAESAPIAGDTGVPSAILTPATAPEPPQPETAALPTSAGDSVAAAVPGAPAALVLDVEFTGESWLTVGLDGKPQPARLYRSGDTARFEATTEILVDAANAGVARLAINGRVAKPLGASGVHVRTRITTNNLAQFY